MRNNFFNKCVAIDSKNKVSEWIDVHFHSFLQFLQNFPCSLVFFPFIMFVELVPPRLLEKSVRVHVLTAHRMIDRLCVCFVMPLVSVRPPQRVVTDSNTTLALKTLKVLQQKDESIFGNIFGFIHVPNQPRLRVLVELPPIGAAVS